MADVFDLNGRTALVTGGGGDIGAEISRMLAASGARVAVTDIDEDAAALAADTATNAARGDGAARAFALDVTDADSIDRCFTAVTELWDAPDIVVNNAIVACPIPPMPHEAPDEIWDQDIDVILKGGFRCARRALPAMMTAGTGVIISILSVNAHEFYGHPSYSAAKAGMRSFTQSLASVYGQYGVRAVSISPGTIRTKAWDQQIEKDASTFERLEAWYPLGRVGAPRDVASAVAFASSDSAGWITGSDLVVDGGLMAGNPTMARSVEGS